MKDINIQILQGINIKNPITTVIIPYKPPKKELLEYFKQLHPIFIKDYKFINNNVEITTKLPFFWANSDLVKILIGYSSGKIDYNKAKISILKITETLIHSMSTIPILHGAHKLGYETFPFYTNKNTLIPDKSLNKYFNIGIGRESAITQSAASSSDSKLGFLIQRDKWLTNNILDLLELDIAAWSRIDSEADLPYVAKEIGFPMVIKPAGLTGGACVKVGIKNYTDLKNAYTTVINELKEREKDKISPYSPFQKQIIAQKMVSGKDFRILVVNGKVEIATNRIPARVIGNGKNTVKELINKENKDPKRNISLPTHTLKPITVDQSLINIVKEQGFSMDDIPPKGKIVNVRKVASMSQGGITKDYTDKINPQIKLICESIAQSVHSYVLGIDVLCKDITKPLTPENGSIIEINTMPESYLNAFPVIGKQYPNIGEKIVRGLIDPNIHTYTVVVIGKINSKTILDIIKKNGCETSKIGLLEKRAIYIDSHLINDNVNISEGLLALKRNKLLGTIIVHYEDEEGVMKYGTGFDSIDILAYDKNVSKQVVEKFKSYYRHGFIHKLIKI